jgi:hypothetical protein
MISTLILQLVTTKINQKDSKSFFFIQKKRQIKKDAYFSILVTDSVPK